MRVEQNGSETCEVATNGAFILVRVPVRVVGEVENGEAYSRYRVGGFVGRETTWPSGGAHDSVLTFRIPRELFRERERLTVEVLRTDDQGGSETLWAKRYQLRWVKDAAVVEPVPDSSSASGEESPA
jgi:hypothetical protein